MDRVISTPICSYCIQSRYCQNHRRILPNFLLFVWFDTVKCNPCRVQTTRGTMMYFSLIDSDIHWLCVGFVYWLGYLDSFMLIFHMKQILPKSSQRSAEFPIVCMIWYSWMQSSAMLKQQYARWSSSRGWISISIDYAWSVCIDMAISTPIYTYCIWNSYIKKSPLVTGIMRETIFHAGL